MCGTWVPPSNQPVLVRVLCDVCVDAQPATQSSFHLGSAIIYLSPVTVETSPAAQPRGGTDPGGKGAWMEPADGGAEASSLSEQRKRDLCTRNQHQFWFLLTSWSLVPSNQPVVWASARFVAVVQKFPETKIIFPDSSRSQRMGGGRRGQAPRPRTQTQDPPGAPASPPEQMFALTTLTSEPF